MNVEKGEFTIDQLDVTCRYGGKSYPSPLVIAEYASEHPLVKTFKLAGTDIEFSASLATPTIGTKITAGNKVINGVDPKTRESVGGGGGGSLSSCQLVSMAQSWSSMTVLLMPRFRLMRLSCQ